MLDSLSMNQPPLHFAGREKELAVLDYCLANAASSDAAPQGMITITGAPGIGKTELAKQFAVTCGANTAVMEFRPTDFDDPSSLFATIGEAVGQSPAFEHIADAHKQRLHDDGAGTGRSQVPSLGAMLKDASTLFDVPVVMIVDDLHSLEEKNAAPIRDLHEGEHGCPILTIGVGLPHTRRVLMDNGVHKLPEGIDLGPLHREVTLEIIAESLTEVGRVAPRDAVRQIADMTEDHPLYIQNYLSASIDAVADERAWHKDFRSTMTQIHAEGWKKCTQWHDELLSEMGDGRDRMIPLIAELRRGTWEIPKDAAADLIQDAGFDGKQTLDDAVRHGVITEQPFEHTISLGVPMLYGHLFDTLNQRELHELPSRSSRRRRKSRGR